MECKIDGCENKIMYKTEGVCQKHYFRRMRNGTYENTRTRKKVTNNPAGYIKIDAQDHELSNADGYAYEHRLVYHAANNGEVSECAICGTEIDWNTCHIDHIDEDIANNDIGNLRALCRGCNVYRTRPSASNGKTYLTAHGLTMTPTAWSRQKGVTVSGKTIRLRKIRGYSDYDAIYAKKVTHKNAVAKKTGGKNDKIRGMIAPLRDHADG